LPVEAGMSRPLIGMVSRMTEQTGVDLLAALAPQLPSLDASFAVVGTGDRRFEVMWESLAAAYPDRFGVFIGFDERRAHLVEAGADLFLMPSRYEPCGLNQIYSLRYGTVPVVRATGGLADTVRDGATGFSFGPYTVDAMLDALRRALAAYRDRKAWRRMMSDGMAEDFGWSASAKDYLKLYES
jgi:starch synthase